jgi:hypothetical protein
MGVHIPCLFMEGRRQHHVGNTDNELCCAMHHSPTFPMQSPVALDAGRAMH